MNGLEAGAIWASRYRLWAVTATQPKAVLAHHELSLAFTVNGCPRRRRRQQRLKPGERVA